MAYDNILYEQVADRVVRITLNRPQKMNALSHGVIADLEAGLAAAERDPEVHVIVLAGAGRAFCAGYDLKGSPYISYPPGFESLDHWTAEAALKTTRRIEALYRRVWDAQKPIIASIHGYCLAGGLYLSMLCDLALAAEDAQLGEPMLRFGGASSMPLWVLYLGPRKAFELLYLGRAISGREAAQINLVNRAVPPEQLEAETLRWAQEIAEAPREALMSRKEFLRASMAMFGLEAMFRYHGHMNAMSRLERGGGNRMLENLESGKGKGLEGRHQSV